VPPEELSEKQYRKAYRRALIAEARHQSSMEQAFTRALTTVLKNLKIT